MKKTALVFTRLKRSRDWHSGYTLQTMPKYAIAIYMHFYYRRHPDYKKT